MAEPVLPPPLTPLTDEELDAMIVDSRERVGLATPLVALLADALRSERALRVSPTDDDLAFMEADAIGSDAPDAVKGHILRLVASLRESERLRVSTEQENAALKERLKRLGEETPLEHSAYADPLVGGADGYQAACWDCDWRSESIHYDKGDAQDEARAHRLSVAAGLGKEA